MVHVQWSGMDRQQIEAHGLTIEEVERQLALLRSGVSPAELVRPCTPGDGILVLDADTRQQMIDRFNRVRSRYRILRFVPAAGAATRMWRDLYAIRDTLRSGQTLDAVLREKMQRFFHNLHRFAFYEALDRVIRRRGERLSDLLESHAYARILDYLLEPGGLGYGDMPKGLVPFHRYPDRPRTAAEEHLVEATVHACGSVPTAVVHFVTRADHALRFRSFLDQVKHRYETTCRIHLEWSIQSPSTDTVAIDGAGRIVRDANGRILFRPGGHGALLSNLNRLDADLVFVKNIDNVAMDAYKPATFEAFGMLGGVIITVREAITALLQRVTAGTPIDMWLPDAEVLLRRYFFTDMDTVCARVPDRDPRQAILRFFDRPLRVCGMVRNVGEPGGGPFWVRMPNGEVLPQIVESAQVDLDHPKYREIWNGATHFNPVVMVLAMRDGRGRPYDLFRFSEPEMAFITEKYFRGQPIRALEHPGLWNGGMAYWRTIFVEIPRAAFNPVKTVFDLLRPEHQQTP